MEYSVGNILTKESRGAIIIPKIKGFLFLLRLIPQADEKSIFRADKGMPLSLSFQESDNPFKNIRGLPRVCSGPQKMISRKVKKTIYCVCSGNRIVPEPVSLRICGCRQQPGRKQRRKHHRTANRLNCYYRAGCRCMCRRRHQLCCV